MTVVTTAYTWGEVVRLGSDVRWNTTKRGHIIAINFREKNTAFGTSLCGLVEGTVLNSTDYTAPDLALGIRLNPRRAERLCQRCITAVSKLGWLDSQKARKRSQEVAP